MPVPVIFLLLSMQAGSPVVVTGHFWAPFISPMGEPFRARIAEENTLARWFYQADGNRDGRLVPDEMVADANRFFAILDSDGNGAIDPEELRRYEWELAPDIQVMSKTRPAPGEAAIATREQEKERPKRDTKPRRKSGKDYGLEGGARYALLNMPEPVAAADTDFNRAVTIAEFRQAAVDRFRLLDSTNEGSLSLAQLQSLLPSVRMTGRDGKRPKKDAPDERLGNPLPKED